MATRAVSSGFGVSPDYTAVGDQEGRRIAGRRVKEARSQWLRKWGTPRACEMFRGRSRQYREPAPPAIKTMRELFDKANANNGDFAKAAKAWVWK